MQDDESISFLKSTIEPLTDFDGSPMDFLRDRLSPEERTADLYHHIDPWLVNERLMFSTFGQPFRDTFLAHRKPGEDHWARLGNDHILTRMALISAKTSGAVSSSDAVLSPKVGLLVCSTDQFQPTPGIYTESRVTSELATIPGTARHLNLEFSPSRIAADTGRSSLASGIDASWIGVVTQYDDHSVTCQPLVIGNPWLEHPINGELGAKLMFYAREFFEVLPEDIEQFRGILKVPDPPEGEWAPVMRSLPEKSVKSAICQILGDQIQKDSGSENEDHFSDSPRLNGRRIATAFVLKGPAGGKYFHVMTLDMCGDRANQIIKMANTEAALLIVQHCHEIGSDVRRQLRHEAVQPSNPRKYCLLDGKTTYRLMKFHGLLPTPN